MDKPLVDIKPQNIIGGRNILDIAEDYRTGKEKGRPVEKLRKEITAINSTKRAMLDRPQMVKRTKRGILVKSKLNSFVEAFLKSNGNVTQAAMEVGNYSSRSAAASAGNRMLKQATYLNQIYLEEQGFSYGELMKEALKKMQEAKDPQWWDRIMRIGGYDNGVEKHRSPSLNVNVFQAHKNMSSEYIEGEEVKDISETEEDGEFAEEEGEVDED